MSEVEKGYKSLYPQPLVWCGEIAYSSGKLCSEEFIISSFLFPKMGKLLSLAGMNFDKNERRRAHTEIYLLLST